MTNKFKLFGTKLGMSRMFFNDGTSVAVTLVQVPDAHVVGFDKPQENADFQSVLIAHGPTAKERRVPNNVKGQIKKANVPLCKKISGFKAKKDAEFKLGDVIDVSKLTEGMQIDVQGHTTGKGFAGVLKRHNFGGLRASHGVSISHRSHGSTGQCQDPGKVFKGMRMAGHLGTNNATIKNLKVLEINSDDKVVCLQGAVPGKKGSEVILFIKEQAGK